MILIFEHKNGDRAFVADVNDEHEAFKQIQDFLKTINYRSYYTRLWSPEPGHQIIDFGSHTEFFHLYVNEAIADKGQGVLFLDYDGVVNTMMWSNDGKHCGYNFPSHNRVNNFQAVQWISDFCIKYKFDIVVTSTWRFSDNYAECLMNGGLNPNINILGRTPHLPFHKRGEEIKEYLSEHPEVKSYIIVDDEDDMLPEQQQFFVKTNEFYGFGYPDFKKCVDIINKNNGNF